MNEDHTTVPPIVPGIFTIPREDKTPPELIGGYCQECKKYFFPCPKYCQRCLGAVERAAVGRKGTIYSYTIIRVKPPLGLPSPYAVGYIDLKESGLRIFCLLDPKQINQFGIGLWVELAVDVMGHNGQGALRLRPFFTLS